MRRDDEALLLPKFDYHLDESDPDIVVLEGVGNYGLAGTPPLPGIPLDSDAFFMAWQAEAAELTAVWTTGPTPPAVWWVVNPPFPEEPLRTRAVRISEGYIRLGTEIIDAHAPFAGSAGFRVADNAGRPLRAVDGIHLSDEAGRKLYADPVVAAIAPVLIDVTGEAAKRARE